MPSPGRTGGPVPTESERPTVAIKVRLSPATAARLRALGASHPGGVSGWVAAQVEATDGEGRHLDPDDTVDF